jgi:hypothetical protein
MVAYHFCAAAVVVLIATMTVVATDDKDKILSYKGVERPFRMNKVNLLWEKARLKLTEGKLMRLYSDLMLHDKEELTLKRLLAEQGDKDGMRNAQVRKKFTGIMNTYGLAGVKGIEDVADGEGRKHDQLLPKFFFKDKKLNRLWDKAEKAGLTEEERHTLKQEFMHHQDKVEQYNKLLDMTDVLGKDGNVMSNDIAHDDDHHKRDDNALDGLAKSVKDDYDRLHKLSTNTNPKEFEDDRVVCKFPAICTLYRRLGVAGEYGGWGSVRTMF